MEYKKSSRNIKKESQYLENPKVIIFIPTTKQIYPSGPNRKIN
jgi:pantothenate synthetase